MINLYKIKDIGNFFGGLTGKSKEDFNIGNAKFVSYMTVFSNPQLPDIINDTVLISENEKQNKIKKGDILFTGSSETPDECGMSCVVTQDIDEDIYLNSFCFGLRLNNKEIANPAYLSHYFRSNYARKQIKKTANGVTRFNISKKKFSEIEIVIPPIKVQEEIVKILDSFTNLIDALNEELSLRQKQLEYYRDQLYDDLFKKTKGVDVLCFSELGQIERGKRFVRDDIKTHGQPCIHYGDMYTYYGVKSNKAKTYLDRDFPKKMRYADNGDVIIVGAGENNWDIGVGLAWLGEEPAAVHDACYIVKHNNNPLFIAYYTRTTEYHQQLKKCVSEGKICSFSAEGLGKVTIPIPSLAIQQSIVEKLDAFESLISSLQEEIALRQKQYEYYREKLLTFD